MSVPELSSLPSPRAFLRDLIDSIPAGDPNDTSQNLLQALQGKDRASLLTLHVLYPNEFLPALDLLDRGCVIRMRTRKNVEETGHTTDILRHVEDAGETMTPSRSPSVYYVRSAQASSSHAFHRRNPSHNQEHSTQHYEVRLDAWNCSCPAFTFASLPSVSPPETSVADLALVDMWCNESGGEGEGDQTLVEDEHEVEGGWTFGGMRLSEAAPPVCKHLLACVLVDRTGLFARFVEDREVSMEELAGWAAGWGA